MRLKDKIDKNKLPSHIAIIMDGNGRWAQRKGNKRIFGHKNAVKAVNDAVEASAELGIKYLTLYTFSIENWKRPKVETDALMSILVSTIKKEKDRLVKNNIRLLTIGDTGSLPSNARKNLVAAIEETSANTGLSLVLALSYSGRWEITKAVNNIIADVKGGKLDKIKINDEKFSSYLSTANIPDPELLIRTSGEYRISNFLLWQTAYTELYFTDILWPDFRKENLYEAIIDFQKRERRFGKTSEQMTK